MKTFKRLLMPVLVGIISAIIPITYGFKVDTWQYWWIAAPIILMIWIIYPIHEQITKK